SIKTLYRTSTVAREVPAHIFDICNWLSLTNLKALTLVPHGPQPLLEKVTGLPSLPPRIAGVTTEKQTVKRFWVTEDSLILLIGSESISYCFDSEFKSTYFEVKKPKAQFDDGIMRLYSQDKLVFTFTTGLRDC